MAPEAVVGVRRHRQHRDRPAIDHAYAAHRTSSRPVRRLEWHRRAGWPCPTQVPRRRTCTPAGVWTDGQRIVVAEPRQPPGDDLAHATRRRRGTGRRGALGQPDFTSEGPAVVAQTPGVVCIYPTGVAVVDGDLLSQMPGTTACWCSTASRTRPRGTRDGHRAGGLMASPTGAGNRVDEPVLAVRFRSGRWRVPGWRTPGTAGCWGGGWAAAQWRTRRRPVWSVGCHRREDNSGELGDSTFRWPHAIAGDEDTLFIADAGNHRVLGPRHRAGRPARRCGAGAVERVSVAG